LGMDFAARTGDLHLNLMILAVPDFPDRIPENIVGTRQCIDLLHKLGCIYGIAEIAPTCHRGDFAQGPDEIPDNDPRPRDGLGRATAIAPPASPA